MNKTLPFLLGLPAVVFLIIGATWWVAPTLIAPQLGMSVQEGVGLSSQIGDLGSFFAVMGACILTALVTGNRSWFGAALMLIGVAAAGRVVAWAFHDAPLAWDMLAVEVPVAALLAYVSTREAPPS